MSSDKLDMAEELRRQKIRMSDLDRCVHGRHSIDNCVSCPDGWSTGNLFLMDGMRIGTDYAGNPIIVQTRRPLRSGRPHPNQVKQSIDNFFAEVGRAAREREEQEGNRQEHRAT